MIKVLFLSAWYPNRSDAMFGLFVRKHAEAVSLYCEVQVLYVHADKHIKHFEMTESNFNSIKETTVYYPASNFLMKHVNYLKAYQKGFKHLKKKGFNPNILHANILTRTVFIAYFYQLITRVPYVITEHWSRYLPARDGYHGLIRKWITRLVVKKSSAVLPVSIALKEAMISHGIKHPNYHIIYNVVDDFFYQEQEKNTHSTKRFLHISCFDEQAKNIKGIIKAAKQLATIRNDFELIIIGTGIDYEAVCTYYKSLQMPAGRIRFLGEVAPKEVAQWFAKSDCFVLFSNYETAGVVIAESLASGKPVITTKVGIAEEFIHETTGIIVEHNNHKALAEAMNHFLDHSAVYDSHTIKSMAQSFTYPAVGQEILNIYKKILQINS